MTLREQLLSSRSCGILLPLAAMKTEQDWGVGDFGSLTQWASFFADKGIKLLQILPLQETAPGITCPYSALSSFAIDPVYVDISSVTDIKQSRQAQDLISSLQSQIAQWHQAGKVPFSAVKKAKLQALWLGYQHFLANEQSSRSARFWAFEAYQSAQCGWLRNYSLFRALKEFYKWQTWLEWPEDLRNFNSNALIAFEAQHREYVRFFAYVQWILDGQLREAKAFAQQKGILIFGDIPFGTNLDSADVWAEWENYRLGWEIGAPADQFSKGGQKWGLPAYNWEYQHQHNLDLWRRKIRRVTELYDVFRLDHLVGFFRTYVFAPGDENGSFDVQGEQNQIDRGYAFLRMVLDEAHGKLAVGEDLGVIPNYVRRMLVDLKIPGYKVLCWEREDNGYYREPRRYPVVSLATTSTHDTQTLRGWWEAMEQQERAHIWEMISTQKTDGQVPWNEVTQRAILYRVLDAASAIVMFSWQDIIGTTDRINTPGTVGEENWTYRSSYTPRQAEQVYEPQWCMLRKLLGQTGRLPHF
ncbi:MAG: 4-alpha-glucanotransferase [Elusimicrobiaceae bacterium]|nr:4-alpha-glucanotransferase [Elusimicrobiaceae bacterium]